MGYTHLPVLFVEKYARPPANSTVKQAIANHSGVRALLGDTDYATLLQGSYKNDTALWDMNDVDIVAVSRHIYSAKFSNAFVSGVTSWSEIFDRIGRKLQSDVRYQGKWTLEDKCIRLNTGIKIDIVPAVRIGEPETDPIAIYSRQAGEERKNWPRGHWERAAAKSAETNGSFKQSVRLFKRWARCWFGTRKVAHSYFLECLVYAQPAHFFSGDLAETFVVIASAACNLAYGSSTLARVAGEGNLLSAKEWDPARFAEFQGTLQRSRDLARAARAATNEWEARRLWVAAFNGREPT